jgi:hypothetical protein
VAGFNSVRQIKKSIDYQGKFNISSFRRVVSNATVAGCWSDLSYSPGNTPPNFYATEPLIGAVLPESKGIWHGGDVGTQKKYLKNLMITSASTAAQSSGYILCDYLLYYPFIDGDAAGVDQALDNTVTVNKYDGGKGVRAILVAQGAYTGGVSVTINYTNSAGVAGRVSPTFTTSTAAVAASLLSGGTNAGGSGPFIPLQSGDIGIRSVESINFVTPNGGICALVLVKPIAEIAIAEVTATHATPCRRENFTDMWSANQIEDGAYLNFLVLPNASMASAVLQGTLTTVWG